MNTLETVAEYAATLTYSPRPDYGPDVEAAHSNTLDSLIGWECPTGICQGDDDRDWDDGADADGEYRGWPKWQRIERSLTTHRITSVTIECGHCGCTTDILTGEVS